MAQVMIEPIPTVADLLAQLGDIPPSRVLMRPAPGTATEQDVIALLNRHDRHKRLCELVDGVLGEKTIGGSWGLPGGLGRFDFRVGPTSVGPTRNPNQDLAD